MVSEYCTHADGVTAVYVTKTSYVYNDAISGRYFGICR